MALEERIGNVSTGLSEETILKLMKQKKYSVEIGSQREAEPCCVCQVNLTGQLYKTNSSVPFWCLLPHSLRRCLGVQFRRGREGKGRHREVLTCLGVLIQMGEGF